MSSNPATQEELLARIVQLESTLTERIAALEAVLAAKDQAMETVQFNGNVSGCSVGIFVNASGQRLERGDVVALKGTPVVRYYGVDNKIPVVEVTLASYTDAREVIGIVDGPAIPGPGEPDTRANQADSEYVDEGGELYVVMSGPYRYCKVETSVSSRGVRLAIRAGQWLGLSKRPGYATNGGGRGVGLALQPFDGEIGYIPVLVRGPY